ncbi:DUF4097 family beta strand repeat-containing protein [Actinoplanes ianthinogenes]|nr:DUF4097 family beta strand repeat-containing protein [Actinoplanes ianthinogenes]
MPTFETPKPISATVEITVGNVRITASDRTDTVVEVRPSDPADESDVEAARQAQVHYAFPVLRVTGPKRLFDLSRKTRSIEVSIELPSGSGVVAGTQAGDIRGAGRLGGCRFTSAAGDVIVESTGPAYLHTGAGHISAGLVSGEADISTGTGRIELGEVDGPAVVKNSNGNTTIDGVGRDVRVRAANGDIRIDRAGAGVDAKSSNGSIRLGEVVRGAVTVSTASGDLDIGVADGSAAYLEINTSYGYVHNLLQTTTRPQPGVETVEVRGRTSYGDITIRRS